MSLCMTWQFLWLMVLTSIIANDGQSIPKQYSSYRPMAICNPSDYMRYPTTINDVVLIVQEAISRGVKVKAFGARHSQTDIICTEGIPIDNHGLKFYEINLDGTATFGAGVTLHEATEFLRNNNRAFRTTPGFGNITLAGAIGTGAHGSTIKYTSSISAQVVGVTVVDGLGVVQNITNESDLNAFRIHLGLLGVLVRITLTTFPLYKTLAHNYIVSDAVLTNGVAQQWALESDQISLYWFPSINQVVVANWTIIDPDTTGDAFTYDHVPSTYDSFNILSKALIETSVILTQNRCSLVRQLGFNIISTVQTLSLATLVTTVPDFVPIYTEDGITVQNPAVGYYDKMFAPVCNDGPGNGPLQCAWGHGNVNANITILDNEVSLALSDMPQFISAVKDILTKAPALFPIQGILMRFSAQSETYMSNAYGRDSVHFEWYMPNRDNMYQDAGPSLAAYQTIMQTLTKQFNGRSHWGKSGMVYQSSPMLDLKLNPIARASFISAMTKYDPNEVFINNFGRRIKGTSSTLDTDPNNVHCALRDDCFCSESSDCASYQRCVTLPGYDNYNVCQTIGEQPQTFILSSLPPTTSLTQWMNSTLATIPGVLQQLLTSVTCHAYYLVKSEDNNIALFKKNSNLAFV